MRCIFLIASFLVQTASAQTTGPETAFLELDHGFKDGNPLKRVIALANAGVMRPQPRPVAMIEALLDDKDLGVRGAACSALGEMKSKGSIPKLRAALSDKAPEVVFAAAKALYSMDDASGREVLQEILTGEQKDASGFVSNSLRDARMKLYDPKALLLIGVNQAAGFLGAFGAAVPLAEQLMKDGQASGKTVAALMLANDHSDESKPALTEALADKNWTVRVAALRAVALRDLTANYDQVATMLADDKREEVRYAAASAAIRLKQVPEKPKVLPRRRPLRVKP